MKKHDYKQLMKMFIIFFKIGAFTIGGGMAMLPLIEGEVVSKNKWISEEDIVDIFAISQSTPGVIAINSSVFIGYKLGGSLGAVIAALGVILPSFISILLIAVLLINIRDNTYVQRAFAGVRAGVTALILLATLKLGKSIIKDAFSIIVSVAAFIVIVILDIHPAFAILGGATAGITVYLIRRVREVNS